MAGVFYVKDYGAVANDGKDDTAAIQRALDAAEAAGGGTVVMEAGQYDLRGGKIASDGGIRVGSNITLTGAGMAINGGGTTLRVMDGYNGNITGVVRTPVKEATENVTLSNFTIDGNRANNSGKVDGFFCGVLPGDPRHASNITVDGVEIKNCSGYGFDPHEQTYNLTIQNSVAHGNGLDGFVADYITGGVYKNNIAFNNDRHGFNICTSSSNVQLIDNIAYDNGANGVTIQRGSDNIPWPSNITISGGEYYNNGQVGILAKMANGVTIDGVEVHGNGRDGIYLWGATNSTIKNSDIHDNSQSKSGGYDAIKIAQYDESSGVSGKIYDSLNNIIKDNHIYTSGAIQMRYGVSEAADGSGNNQVLNNDISGVTKAAIFLSDFASIASGFDGEGTIAHGGLLFTGGKANDTITGTDGNDMIYGGEGNDTLKGNNGNDTLIGGKGADAMTGGNGDDIYYVDNAGDTVVEKTGGGNDTIFSSVDFTMNSNMETLILLDGAINGNGSSNDNSITGNGLSNSLTGGSGNDKLYGMDGDDYLSGGTGNDILDGGKGNDTLKGGDGSDRLIGGAGKDDLYGDAGADRFVFTALDDSGKGVDNADTIRDFNKAESDKIDVSAIASQGGTFNFIGTAEFTNTGHGQIDYHVVGTKTLISVDANGDGVSDMDILLTTKVALTASDFILS